VTDLERSAKNLDAFLERLDAAIDRLSRSNPDETSTASDGPAVADHLRELDEPWRAAPAADQELIERVAARVLERMSDRVVREAVSQIVPPLAERLIREAVSRTKVETR